MNTLGPLADHTARMLTGTGIAPEHALDVASGRSNPGGMPAAALADGWRAAAEGTKREGSDPS